MLERFTIRPAALLRSSGREEVGLEDLAQRLLRGGQRAVCTHVFSCDSGVVHQNVESAKLAPDRLRRGLSISVIHHVHLQRARVDAFPLQLRRGRLALLYVARAQQHRDAQRAQLPRRLQSDPLVRAGYQRNLLRRIAHRISSPCHLKI